MNLSHKPEAQLSLESIMEKNKADAQRLKREADAKLEENARIEAEMHRILSEPPPAPPASRLVDAFTSVRPGAVPEIAPASAAPLSMKLAAEREVVYAALAIVRSWQRRHKKTFHAQEKELMNAVERLTWEK